jgi:hypothetical protein
VFQQRTDGREAGGLVLRRPAIVGLLAFESDEPTELVRGDEIRTWVNPQAELTP